MGKYLTVKEVAAELRCEPDTVRRLIRDGKISAYKPGKAYLVTEEAVKEYAEGADDNVKY